MKKTADRKVVYLSALLFFGVAAAFAEPVSQVHWEFAGWYGGGCFPNVEFDPKIPDRVYLTSDVAGLWRSDDLGENWYFATQGLGNINVAVLAVARSDSDVIYAGTYDGVYYSKDAAKSWQAASTLNGRVRFSRPEAAAHWRFRKPIPRGSSQAVRTARCSIRRISAITGKPSEEK